MKTISLKLSDGLHATVKRVARVRKQAPSDLVRNALEQFLDDPQKRHTITFGDLAGDLLGAAQGPADLATHSKGVAEAFRSGSHTTETVVDG